MTARLHRFLTGAVWKWRRNARSWNGYKVGDTFTIISRNKSSGKLRIRFDNPEEIELEGGITARPVSGGIPVHNILIYAQPEHQPEGFQYLLWNHNSKEYLNVGEIWDAATKQYHNIAENWRNLAPVLDRLALLENLYAWDIHKGIVNNDSMFEFQEKIHVPIFWKANVLKLRRARVYVGSKLPMERLAGLAIRPGFHSYKRPSFEPRGLLCAAGRDLSFHRTYEQTIAARLAGADNMRIVDLR